MTPPKETGFVDLLGIDDRCPIQAKLLPGITSPGAKNRLRNPAPACFVHGGLC